MTMLKLLSGNIPLLVYFLPVFFFSNEEQYFLSFQNDVSFAAGNLLGFDFMVISSIFIRGFKLHNLIITQ